MSATEVVVTCASCRRHKPLDDFYRYPTGSLYRFCKPCHYARTQQWRSENREKIRELDRRRYHAGGRIRKVAEKRLKKYGITQQQFDDLLEEQGGVCPICLLPFIDSTGRPGSWDIASVDHCHATGRVRGILHRRCNLALELGFTEEDWRRARAYLAAEI